MAEPIRMLTREDLEKIIQNSQSSPRGRAPNPLNPDEYPGPQCLINAIQPSSYVVPHRHEDEEIWLHIQGRVVIGLFNEEGEPTEKIELAYDKTLYFVAPGDIYHSVFAIEPDSVFFNVSQGPFNPNAPKDFAKWAPRENAERSLITEYFANMKEKVLRL